MADLSKVMEREQLCSLHAAQCWLEAKRRDNRLAKNDCGCRAGECESKPKGCRMQAELKPGSGAQ